MSFQAFLDDDFECQGVTCNQQLSVRADAIPNSLCIMLSYSDHSSIEAAILERNPQLR